MRIPRVHQNCISGTMLTWIVMLLLSLFGPSKSVPQTFDLVLIPHIRSAEEYSEFLQRIRTYVTDPSLSYGGTTIPVIKAPTNNFFRVDLIISSGTVSLGIFADDLYVKAYMSKNEDGIQCAYYFDKGAQPSQLEGLFPETHHKNQYLITFYDEQYKSLVDVAKIKNKKKLGLGIITLAKYCEKVHKKKRDYEVEATFLLISVQMILEASRFLYIEGKVIASYQDVFQPDDTMLFLETNWGALSLAIKEHSSNGLFEPHVTMTCSDLPGEFWTVEAIEDVKIGLLKHCPEGEEEHGSTSEKGKNANSRDKFYKGPKQPSRSDYAAKKDKKGQSGHQSSERGKQEWKGGRSRGVRDSLGFVGAAIFSLSLSVAIALIATMLLLRKVPYPLRPGDLSKVYK